MSRLLIPSYENGFAPRNGPPENPNLWDRLEGLYDPSLGVTGIELKDWSGFGNDSVFGGTALTWITDRHGSAIRVLNPSFGVHGYLTAGSYTLPRGTFSTFIRWVDPPWSSNNNLCENVDGFRIRSRSNTTWELHDADGNFDNVPPATSNKWSEYTVTWDTSGAIIYVDGVQVDTTVRMNTFGTGALTLLNFVTLNRSFDGDLGRAAIWNRALLPSEVQQLADDYNAITRLRSKVYPATVAAGGGISHIIGSGIVV